MRSDGSIEVDFASIEKSLADLWRAEGDEAGEAVTRAALWNMLAHTANDRDRATASGVLAEASAKVPQRSIIVRADPREPAHLAARIRANCHLVGGGKQVCSEEVAIVAGGERVYHLPPLVRALLLPDMPVAAWWLGDLPSEQEYVCELLDPVDRLIVDSASFDSPDDLDLVTRLAQETETAPADLNWVRLEQWRLATASLFDRSDLRGSLFEVERVRVVTRGSRRELFGRATQGCLYGAWIASQLGIEVGPAGEMHGERGEVRFELDHWDGGIPDGGIDHVELHFPAGKARVEVPSGEAIRATLSRDGHSVETVTPRSESVLHELVVRQLSQADDHVYRKIIPVAARLGRGSEG